MLLNAGEEERTNFSRMATYVGLPLAVGSWRGTRVLGCSRLAASVADAAAVTSLTRPLAMMLFQDYVFPFELTSILILIAILGAVVLARRESGFRLIVKVSREIPTLVPVSYYVVLSAAAFRPGRHRLAVQAEHRHHVHVHRADAERRESGVRRVWPCAGPVAGTGFVFFVIVVAAAEAAVGSGNRDSDRAQPQDAERGARESAQAVTKLTRMFVLEHLWIIPLLPLLGAAVNGIVSRIFGRSWPHSLQMASRLARRDFPSRTALELFREFSQLAPASIPWVHSYFPWIVAGGFRADYALQVDQLTMVMLLIVTGVGFVIHIYSTGYMAHEEGYARFFSYLNLFMFFMLTLVLAANYVVLFVGWEGVGLCSYLLVGFYFLREVGHQCGQ